MEEAKDEFLRQFGEDYGYPNAPKKIDEIRASEFKRLEGLVYLDHAGATLYSETQMEAVAKDLTSNVFGNPHSQSDPSLATSDFISAARQQVLDFCNASPKDYKCIFTSGATAALKLVGESFPWSRQSCYMYTMENHNSVLGIREYALSQGATAVALDIEEFENDAGLSCSSGSSIKIHRHSVQTRARSSTEPPNGEPGNVYNLFAFPSECNFSGRKFHLDLVNTIKEDAGRVLERSTHNSEGSGCWMVLIDAAKGCATQPPDLASFPADFVALSFYKIFGYPTGLGALIVRTEAAKLLKRTFFGGGTVSSSIADIDFVKRRESVEQSFEDGTLSFLSIAGIHHGFRIINTLTVSAIARHTTSLSAYVKNVLESLRHENGAEVCTLYGRNNVEGSSFDMGPIIAFNLKRPDGSWFGYHEVEKLASLSGIHLRTGCFCNPGACAKYLGLSHSDLLSNIEAGHVCWDDYDILHGKPTGAVRISFGYMSTFEDAKNFLGFVENSFLSNLISSGKGYLSMTRITPFLETERRHLVGSIHLQSIIVYPIKSCAGFVTERWPLSSVGLLYDREWLLKSLTGEPLTQKKVPDMCKIHAFVDWTQRQLLVESPFCKEKLQVSLEYDSANVFKEELILYGQRYEVQGYNTKVNMWFTEAIGHPCTLVRCAGYDYASCKENHVKEGMCRDLRSKLNFVNEAQLLLISADSVCDLNDKLRLRAHNGSHGSRQSVHIDPGRFRPNLVISGAEPYAEDKWRSINIGKSHFTSLGGCNRCQMINIDPQATQMQKSKEPLATLASFRRVKGKILFGILLRYENSVVGRSEEIDNAEMLQVGQEVYPDPS